MSPFLDKLRRLMGKRVAILVRCNRVEDRTISGKLLHVEPQLCLLMDKGNVVILTIDDIVNFSFKNQHMTLFEADKPARSKVSPFVRWLSQLVGKPETRINATFRDDGYNHTGKVIKVEPDVCYFEEKGEEKLIYIFAISTVRNIMCKDTDLTIKSEVKLEEIK